MPIGVAAHPATSEVGTYPRTHIPLRKPAVQPPGWPSRPAQRTGKKMLMYIVECNLDPQVGESG